jgi:hypothetical protein
MEEENETMKMIPVSSSARPFCFRFFIQMPKVLTLFSSFYGILLGVENVIILQPINNA